MPAEYLCPSLIPVSATRPGRGWPSKLAPLGKIGNQPCTGGACGGAGSYGVGVSVGVCVAASVAVGVEVGVAVATEVGVEV